MTSKANVTTPGGFFVGLGGIVCFSVVALAVYFWVKSPSATTELRSQQVALGLRAPDDAKPEDAEKKKQETEQFLQEAGNRYNAGVSPDLDKLEELRGVIRYRESKKSIEEGTKSLHGAAAWKDKAKGEVTMPIELAMSVVANGLKSRPPKASVVKVDIMPAPDPNAPPMMPNAMGGGARTIFFADPNAPAPVPPSAAPVPSDAPANPAAAAPGAPAGTPPTAPPPVAVPKTPPAPAPTVPAPPTSPATPPAPPSPTNPAPQSPAPPTPPAASPTNPPAPGPTTPPPAPTNLPPTPTPGNPPVPAPAANPGTSVTATSPVSAAAPVPAPARPTLLNWPESKK